VVLKYQNEQNIIAWQVENEPFLSTFGICPKLDRALLDSEINLVKSWIREGRNHNRQRRAELVV